MMSTAISSLNKAIQRVEALDVSGCTAAAASTTSTSSAPGDFAWSPRIPAGHTSYSWTGEYGHPHWKLPSPSVPVGSKNPESKTSDGSNGGGDKGDDKVADVPELDEKMELFSKLEFRTGKIVSVRKHPDAESLYIELIDVGEPEPREIVSGLVNFIPEDKMLDARCVVFTNLKANKLRGVLSNGMVLCAKNEEGTVVEFVEPPVDAAPGDRIVPIGFEKAFEEHKPAEIVNLKKKTNPWTPAMPYLKTNSDKVACFNGVPLLTSKGPCVAATLAFAQLS